MVKAVLGDLTPKSTTGKSEGAPQANAVMITDDEPADGPVDAGALLDTTSALIRRHIVLNTPQADAIALWVAAAYVIDALVLMPILLITAPTMRSGKTTLLTLLAAIVPRALAASNLTGAVLARAIAAFNPTLLADEADTWLTDEASELRGIMNAGHTRPTAYILRCAPDTHEPTLIPCFGARVLSMIRRPPSTIADRSIAIDLRRKRADEQVVRLRVDRLHTEHLPLRRLYRRWALNHLDAVRHSNDPAVPASLHDRAADNWRPLLAIADLIGGEWPERARAAAGALSGEDDPEDSISIELLRDIRTIFDGRSSKWISSADLTTTLISMQDRPWAEWSGGRPMTAVKLAARLKPFGLKTQKVRDGIKTVNAYVTADFEDVLSRYLPNNSEQSEQPNVYRVCSDFSDSEHKHPVPTPKTQNNSMFTECVPTVPTSKHVEDHPDLLWRDPEDVEVDL
jgi:putative DNA primase/helicase